ncbi:MAG: glutamine synthetase [Chloroflexi bacterium]|uniref:Glutamine synthetase n=1 Tax=Candidatus Thermofonsia Clade 3 bacterium TaxID=2364212 RepID=A0A2M8QA28_9CHLR|nr:MAG: glutamine synthetase [Candidatus Thermofonsia Clade 3 bacterium]RMG66209.1 MAG: glutamine synthetase [Chloroflexota bacterium]
MTSSAREILTRIQAHNVRFVRFIWCDNANVIRAKAVRTTFIESYLHGEGVGIAAAQQALPVMYDALAPGSGLTPAGEAHMRADWSTFAALPYAPGHARVLTDIYDGEQPWAHCPRSFLRRMIARAADHGVHIFAAFENEFSLLRPSESGPQPFDTTVFCQTWALDQATPIINAITDALEAQGLQVEMAYPESGPGQFELPVRYADALRAADNQIIFRETVKGVARQHGALASFVPKIYPDKAGNGAHLHFSLQRNGRSIVVEPDRPHVLTAEMRAFMAGVLHHLPALMALTTPSTNSFKRIRPRFWSGAYTCWGIGNREAALRAPQPAAGQPITNVELKTSDATANPYLSLGAVIAAGVDGLAKGMTLGEPVNGDPADLSEAERAARGIRQLPATLGEAIAALEQDAVLLDALGDALARSYLAVRRAEWEAMKDLPHAEEVQLLLERY